MTEGVQFEHIPRKFFFIGKTESFARMVLNIAKVGEDEVVLNEKI